MDCNEKIILPFSPVVKVNGLLFTSGLIPIKNGVIINDYKKAINFIFNNMKKLLEDNNSCLEKIVKITIYTKDLSYYDTICKSLTEILKKPYPTMSIVEVKKNPSDAVLEVEAVARV